MIAALAEWCIQTSSTMYVVTRDEAMRRAAEESGPLIPVADLPELLSIATAAETPEIVGLVQRLLASPEFVEPIHEFLRDRIGWIGAVYVGELIDGEAYEVGVIDEAQFEDFSVLSASKETVSLLLKMKIPLSVKLQYHDQSRAFYDREDRSWFGIRREEVEFEDEPVIRLAATIDRESDTIEFIDFITQDVHVSEPIDFYD